MSMLVTVRRYGRGMASFNRHTPRLCPDCEAPLTAGVLSADREHVITFCTQERKQLTLALNGPPAPRKPRLLKRTPKPKRHVADSFSDRGAAFRRLRDLLVARAG